MLRIHHGHLLPESYLHVQPLGNVIVGWGDVTALALPGPPVEPTTALTSFAKVNLKPALDFLSTSCCCSVPPPITGEYLAQLEVQLCDGPANHSLANVARTRKLGGIRVCEGELYLRSRESFRRF
jgi:hypothetical protein